MCNQNLTYGTDRYGHWCQFSIGDVSPTLRWCPPGRFLMGSPEDEPGRWDDEGPQTEITFSEGFWLFDAAVTQELYEAIMGENPSYFANMGKELPVETVSWEEAQIFMKKLNGEIPSLNLRLPSKAEWEYACRAGSKTPFEPSVARTYAGQSITPDEVNYAGKYPYGEDPRGEDRHQTVPVKGSPFRPNNWGLWHMHGNVWEWCEDIWNPSHEGADVNNRSRPHSENEDPRDQNRVVCGGSWFSVGWFCRADSRYWFAPDCRDFFLGFRPVAEICRDASMKTERVIFIDCVQADDRGKKEK